MQIQILRTGSARSRPVERPQGVWSQGPGKVGGGLQVMWGLAGHRKDLSLYSERAEEPLGFEQSGHVTALDFKGSPWLV